MATQMQVREQNEELLSYLENPHTEKRANDAVTNYTRTTMRENGIHGKLVPEVTVTNDQLDRRVDTDLPWIIVDKENNSPMAVTLPFAQLTSNYYIDAPRYAVQFARIMTQQFSKDLVTLRTYVMDLRQVISDNAIKDMLAEQDGKLFSAVNTALEGQDTEIALAGNAKLWQSIGGGMGRNEVVEMLKIPNGTPFNLESSTCVINYKSWKNFSKWGRDEMGGDKAEDIIVDGMHMTRFLDRNWVVSIKRHIIDDETVYQFCDPTFVGKNFSLEPCTLYMKREGPMIHWYFYKTIGAALGHYGFARADFE